MSIKVDTKDLDAFADKLKKASTSTQEEVVDKALKALAAEILARTIKQTPRDTSNLARRWTDHITPDGQLAKNVSQKNYLDNAQITGSGRVRSLTISNSASYAPYVEYGHRTADHHGWVEGKFMLKRALENVEARKDKIVGNVINKYFGDLFND